MAGLAAGVCAISMVISGCSGSSGGVSGTGHGGGASGGSTGTANVVSGGTFTLAMSADPGNLDPQASAASNLYQMSYLAYDSLLSIDGNGKIRSELATSWKVDGTKVTLALHPGITCSDGSAFTATTAAANLNYVANPKNKSPFTGVFLPAGAKATADTATSTVTIELPSPAPFIFDGLAGIPMVCAKGMANRKLLASKTDGTGPFVLASATPGNQYTLTKRTGYTWGPGGATTATAGLPDKIVVKIVSNETTAANLLLSGGLNAATILGPDVSRLESAGLFATKTPTIAGEMWFNHSHSATADPKVRLALTEALDLAQLQKVYTSGRGAPATSFAATAPAACPGNSVKGALPAHDLAKARSLLDADGWHAGSNGIRSKDGKQLALTFVYDTTAGSGAAAASELAAQQWKQLGVKITLKAQDETAITNTAFVTGAWDIMWEPLGVSSPDQIVGFMSGPAPPKGENFAHVDNAAYNAGVAKAEKISGTAGCSTWLAAEANLIKDADVIPFANQVMQTFGKNARFEVVGLLQPTSIRMTH